MWPRAIPFSIVVLHHWLQDATPGVDKPIVDLRIKVEFGKIISIFHPVSNEEKTLVKWCVG